MYNIYKLNFVKNCPINCTYIGIKIIANAGGLNPLSCAESLADAVKKQGLPEMKIGVVTGDDILQEVKCKTKTKICNIFNSKIK